VGRLTHYNIPMQSPQISAKYPWLLFDADDTLFDFAKIEIRSLQDSFAGLDLEYDPAYFPIYQNYNQQVWRELEQKLLLPAELRTKRFSLLFSHLGLPVNAGRFSALFLQNLSCGTDLLEGATAVLQILSNSHHIAIITNGLAEVQRPRLERSSILPLVDKIFISEEMGVAKPSAGFFDKVFAEMEIPSKKDVLIIGDSLTSDIAGGIRCGIDTCWYNPAKAPSELPITYRIASLFELIPIVN
jgi:2-haloacid dehalogenase